MARPFLGAAFNVTPRTIASEGEASGRRAAWECDVNTP
jgi:hypothetical protein